MLLLTTVGAPASGQDAGALEVTATLADLEREMRRGLSAVAGGDL